jgi:hypothetical protein
VARRNASGLVRAGLQGVEAGDMIFNATAGKAQVFDGAQWRDLW